MSQPETISDSLGNTTTSSQPLTDNHQQIFVNDLPDEILIHSFSQLDPSSLNSLRLVCKKWNHVISDKETWTKSFRRRFGIQTSVSSFPSVTHGSNWMQEYFARLRIIRNWKKGISTHQTYQMVNSEHRMGGLTLCDFKMNKLAVFDKVSGNISVGNLDSGKNQSFIPGMMNMDILSYDMNFNYLVMGKKDGGIVVKNLIISTSISQRGSVTNFEVVDEERSSVTSVTINTKVDKNGLSVDVISGSADGSLRSWSLHGKLKNKVALDGIVLNIKSDFSKYIIANTTASVYVLRFENLEILGHAHLDSPMCDEEAMHIEQLVHSKNSLDVDFGRQSIIICRDRSVRVYDFYCTGVRRLDLEDAVVVSTQLQTADKRSLSNVNSNAVVGGDGLLCGNLLSDGSIIVWNVREVSSQKIEPQLRLSPELNHKKISGRIHNAVLNGHLLGVSTFALNASVVAVAGYNGLTCIYDVFTGKFLREVSIKFPKRFDHMQHYPKSVELVQLNFDQEDTNGVIVCGDVIQYFEVGKINSKRPGVGSRKAKHVNMGSHGKHESKKKIRDGMDEYHRQVYVQNKTEELFDRYNGTEFDDEEEEMRVALAMSENMYSNNSSQTDMEVHINGSSRPDNDLALALELSAGKTGDDNGCFQSQDRVIHQTQDDDEVDEELRRALELSLIEH
ncbi:hypothetical protein KGF57_003841 [Candida theae]|uniref:F-box domain-containing protein n=1 Tax=Candida theae TaxID=1198502 RepID=A0AAD5BCD9_9ASCO|nr:uncharacterized protein KGF57_003841 [Candida theae]KAI5954817.1 hypothetical protein KGF57_003841 [Candida theae]